MASDTKKTITPADIGKMLIEPLNYALAAGSRQALAVGVPARDIIEMHLNHLASVISLIEPTGVREQTVMDVIASLNSLVTKHIEARTGGIIAPTQREMELVNG
jgi:hypothetical protein